MSTEESEKVQEIVAEGVAREGLQEMVLPAEEAAARRLADFVSDAAIDKMIADAQDAGVSLLDGPGGLIGQLTARVIERALGAEMDDHLGYVKGDPAGNGTGNSRNGSYGKTLSTTSGRVRIAVPRDRKSAFEPQIVVKGQRRVGQVDEMILSLYARGMTTRDIHAHLAEIYGVEVSPALVSRPFQDHDVSPRMVNGRSMERPAQRVASVTSVRPAMRRAPMARLRRPAMILGPDRVLTWDLSSW